MRETYDFRLVGLGRPSDGDGCFALWCDRERLWLSQRLRLRLRLGRWWLGSRQVLDQNSLDCLGGNRRGDRRRHGNGRRVRRGRRLRGQRNGRCGRRRNLVRSRDDGRVVRRPGVALGHHGNILLHCRRRSIVLLRRIGHVARRDHGAVLMIRGRDRRVVRWSTVGIHVGRMIHGLLLVVLADVLVVMGRVRLLRTSPSPPSARARSLGSSADSRHWPGAWSHVHGSLYGLPSRQMPAIVHHAGLGFGNCGSCSPM